MPLPSNITPVIVTGTYEGVDGTPAGGTVSFTPSKATWLDDTSSPTIILPVTVTGTLDPSGHLLDPSGTTGVKLIPTNAAGVTPTGWTYDVVETLTVTLAGKAMPFARNYSISVPSGATLDLANVAPVAASGPGAAKVVLAVNGVAPDVTGLVTLGAADVGALPSTYTPPAAPVQSVNGKTGLVSIGAAEVGALPVTTAYVASVNGHTTPSVILAAADVGAVAAHSPQALADAPTIATDASTGSHFRAVLGGNRTLGNPTNPADGQKVMWELIQDATGGRTITLGSKFRLGTDISLVQLSTVANARDFLGAVYNATTDTWYVVAFSRGY